MSDKAALRRAIEENEATSRLVNAAIYHVRFPHDDTFDALTRAVDNLPWQDLSGEQEIDNGDSTDCS